jgi:hypothetical protein
MKQVGVQEAANELGEMMPKKDGRGRKRTTARSKPKPKVRTQGATVEVHSSGRAAASSRADPIRDQAGDDAEMVDELEGDRVSGDENMDVDTVNPAPAVPAKLSPTLPLPTSATEPMRILYSLVLKLPQTLEEAGDQDPTAALYREEPWGEDMSTSSAWESWNRELDMLLQKLSMESQGDFNK